MKMNDEKKNFGKERRKYSILIRLFQIQRIVGVSLCFTCKLVCKGIENMIISRLLICMVFFFFAFGWILYQFIAFYNISLSSGWFLERSKMFWKSKKISDKQASVWCFSVLPLKLVFYSRKPNSFWKLVFKR